MIAWYFLLIPELSGLLNRLWRGEGMVPKFVWNAFMIALAMAVFIISHRHNDYHYNLIGMAIAWTMYFTGYSVPPTQAMMSAGHGAPPGRMDGPWFQWIQEISYAILNKYEHDIPPARDPQRYYRFFGMVYGAIRSIVMIPGIILLVWFCNSYMALIGLACLATGVLHYGSGKLSRHFGLENSATVPLFEMAIGRWHGIYILIMAIFA